VSGRWPGTAAVPLRGGTARRLRAVFDCNRYTAFIIGQFFAGARRRRIPAVPGEAEPVLNRDCDILVDRAGVGLLFVDAELRQQIQYYVRFDFQLPCQLIDSDLQLHR
jgi:hypothetical protein